MQADVKEDSDVDFGLDNGSDEYHGMEEAELQVFVFCCYQHFPDQLLLTSATTSTIIPSSAASNPLENKIVESWRTGRRVRHWFLPVLSLFPPLAFILAPRRPYSITHPPSGLPVEPQTHLQTKQSRVGEMVIVYVTGFPQYSVYLRHRHTPLSRSPRQHCSRSPLL